MARFFGPAFETCLRRAKSDAAAIGFNEAPKPKNWVATLEDRGISVTRDICRDEAIAVFQRYQQTGGRIYNARKGLTLSPRHEAATAFA